MSLLLFLIDLVHVDVFQFGVHALILFVVFAFLFLVLEFVKISQQLLEILVCLVAYQSGLFLNQELALPLFYVLPDTVQTLVDTSNALVLVLAVDVGDIKRSTDHLELDIGVGLLGSSQGGLDGINTFVGEAGQLEISPDLELLGGQSPLDLLQ